MKAPIQQGPATGKTDTRQSFLQRKPSNTGAAERPFISPQNSLVIQPKLTVNKPDDAYEQKADAMAEEVMRMPMKSAAPPMISRMHAGAPVQRKCDACSADKAEKEPGIQRKPENGDPTNASDAVTQRLIQREGRGNALPASVHEQMGQAFQADFSDVRIHTDQEAAAMSNDLNAQAFTYGSDIYFNLEKYQPNLAAGQELLGHELSHVIQQREERVQPTGRISRIPLNEDKGLEAEADLMGKKSIRTNAGVTKKNIRNNNLDVISKVLQKKDAGIKRELVSPSWVKTKEFEYLEVKMEVYALGNASVGIDSGAPVKGEYKAKVDTKTGALKRSLKITPKIFDSFDIGFETELAVPNFSVKVNIKFDIQGLPIELKGTIVDYNDDNGEFKWGNISGKTQILKDIEIEGISYRGGVELKLDVSINKKALRDKLLKMVGKKIGKKILQKILESAAIKKMKELGIKTGAKVVSRAALETITKTIGPLATAFEIGWEIGTLLSKYTVAGEIAQEEMNDLETYRDRYHKSGPLGKTLWTLWHAPQIGKNLIEGGVRGVAGAAGKSVGDVIYSDDNVLAETSGTYLERSGFDRIPLEAKIDYIRAIGTGYVGEDEEERIVEIFEYSTLQDRLALFNDSEVFSIYRRGKIDGADRTRLEELVDEAIGAPLDIIESKYQKYAISKKIKDYEKTLLFEPFKAKTIKKDIESDMLYIDDQLQKIERIFYFGVSLEDKINTKADLLEFKEHLSQLSSKADSINIDVFPQDVKVLLDKKLFYERNRAVDMLESFWSGYEDYSVLINELINDYVKIKMDPESVVHWNDEQELKTVLIETLNFQLSNWEEGYEWLKNAKPVFLTAD